MRHSATYPSHSCYGGALVRYSDDGRVVTVIGASDFMTNAGLLEEGNAALAMNLAGTHSRMIWYAPQYTEDESEGAATLSDLIPDQVTWIVWQLALAVVLLALWKGRRIGPLVAERLPVVVRASETVEGRGRLYRSRRARDRAARSAAHRRPSADGAPPRPRPTTRTHPPSCRPSPRTARFTHRRWRTPCSARHRQPTTSWSSSLANSTTSKGRSHSRDTANSQLGPSAKRIAGAAH